MGSQCTDMGPPLEVKKISETKQSWGGPAIQLHSMPLNLSLSMANLMLRDLHRGLKTFKFKPTIAFNFYESRSRIFPSGPESLRTCLLGSLQGTLVHGPVHSPPLSFLLFPFTLTFPSASWKTP